MLNRYNVRNVEGFLIRQIIAPSKESASGKLRFLFGDKSIFLKLELNKRNVHPDKND